VLPSAKVGATPTTWLNPSLATRALFYDTCKTCVLSPSLALKILLKVVVLTAKIIPATLG